MKKQFTPASAETLLMWAREPKLAKLSAYLVSGLVHGKPGLPVAELTRVEKVLTQAFSSEELFQLGQKLLARPEYAARNLGVGFIEAGWPAHPEVEDLIWTAAEDEDWIVREYAAGSFGRLLNKDFAHFSKLYLQWVKSDSVNVKRAIALAVKYDSKSQDLKRLKVYMKLIDTLMLEDAEYIRKNLGPFAIGDGLLCRFPEQTLKACLKWSKSKNENMRWNTAMIFTAAAARRHKKQGQEILRLLARDPSPRVQRAVTKAERDLRR